MIIETAKGTGFCYGVKRAIEMLERAAREQGRLETLGAPVHNQEVLERLARAGVAIARDIAAIQGDAAAIGAHGVTPQVEAGLRAKCRTVLDTTCPFVRRAQTAARRLAAAGFTVVVYGEADHPEVKGILGWANGRGIAVLDERPVLALQPQARRIGILSQTTQMQGRFTAFVKKIVDSLFGKDSELRVVDTICHDIRTRQTAALDLAKRADLMLVVGSRSSANTNHLAELCAAATETHLVQNAGELRDEWFTGRRHVGVTSGASTSEQTINEVLAKLDTIAP